MGMDLAYCVELDKNVYIDQARLAFYSSSSPNREFHFLCTDPHCFQPDGKRTQITATHYKTPPEEITKQRPNFRLFPRQSHDPNCAWIKEEENCALPQQPNESQQDYQKRILFGKILNRIDIFERPSLDSLDDDFVTDNVLATLENPAIQANRKNSRAESGKVTATQRKTKDLESVVTTYLLNRDKRDRGELSDEDFKSISFHIPNEGNQYLYLFFRKYEKVWNDSRFNGVYIVGVRDFKRYGLGFKLFFYESINDKPVSLYVPPRMMEQCLYKNNFESTFIEFEKTRKMKAYFMSPAFKEYTNKMEVSILSLRHLSLRV